MKLLKAKILEFLFFFFEYLGELASELLKAGHMRSRLEKLSDKAPVFLDFSYLDFFGCGNFEFFILILRFRMLGFQF